MGTFRVVVWQSAFLGDLVLTSNLLLNLKEHFPKRKIHLVARPFAKELFEGLDWLEVVPLEKSLKGTLGVIKKIKGFNLGFGVQRGLRTSLALFLAGVKTRVGFDRAEFSFLYHLRAPHRWGVHEVERNQGLLRALGLKVYTDRLFLPINPKRLREVREKFSLPERFAVVSPSANFEPKRWREEHFARVVEFLNKRGVFVVLTGGKGKDEEVARRVKDSVKTDGVLNLAGKTSVGELVHLIKLSNVVVANDSAPVHVAEAVGTPAVAIYCATSSYYGFYPRSGVYFEPKNLECHPCKPNPKRCKRGTEECRSAVKPEEVIQALEGAI